jgi:hypothetical protein
VKIEGVKITRSPDKEDSLDVVVVARSIVPLRAGSFGLNSVNLIRDAPDRHRPTIGMSP